MKPTIGICGFGMVGKAVAYGFSLTGDIKIYDINEKISPNTFKEIMKCDYIFVCVPSPMDLETGKCNTSIVEETVDKASKYIENTESILIIKSTIPPGTTQKYIEKYPKCRIVFNPEFLTARTNLLDFINPARIILGGSQENTKKVSELYRLRFPSTTIFFTDPTSAEMAKYTSNCFLATKVVFFNEIYDICEALNIDYNEVIKMVIADGRIGNSHYDVPGHDGDRGVGGSCFPKDINALIYKSWELGLNAIIMKAVWEKNKRVRKNHDWEH